MSTLEKTINLLNDLPENEVEIIYSYVRFISSQHEERKKATEPIEDIFNNIVGVLPDTGKLPNNITMKGLQKNMTLLIDKTYTIMENIFKLVSILSVTDKDIETAFFKKWKDFEDCVQYTTAKHNSVDYLITSNVHDFEENVFPIISVDEGIVLLEH